MNRMGLIENFLSDTSWSDSKIEILAGDASPRKYYRVVNPDGKPAVVMDAPPQLGNDIGPFLEIAQHLVASGLRAPKIFKFDTNSGMILLEDLGDDLFFNLVEHAPEKESELYHAALDVLDHLADCTLPNDILPYGPKEMADAAGLAPIWYGPDQDAMAISNQVEKTLQQLDWDRPALVLRDYHAQNLLWLPETGLARVGLLDFQDAQAGHRLYDAVSLIFDARRDVSQTVVTELTDRLRSTYRLNDEFDFAFHALSAQRNLRILGVFGRLCARDAKPGYIDLIPRVWRNLQNDLQHPGLSELAKLVANLPQPTDDHLNFLRKKCGTHQAK